MKPYLLAVLMNMRDQLQRSREWGIFLIRIIFLCFMILIFHKFWLVLKAGETHMVIDPVSFLSYLTVGAGLQFSRPEGRVKEIEEEVRTGNIAYRFIRPIHFVLLNFCECLGVYFARLPILFCVGTGMIYLLTGSFPPINPLYLPIVLGLLILSACFASLCMVFIGLSALYFYDPLPFFWIVQKCEYVLGGLFFPIIFYPEWFQKICLMTPFGWTGYGVSSLIYDFSFDNALTVFLHLIAWNALLLGALLALYKTVQKKVCVYG